MHLQLVATTCLTNPRCVAIAANMDFLIAGANISGVDAFAESLKPVCRDSDDSIILARAAGGNAIAGFSNCIERA